MADLETYLAKFTEAEWLEAVETLLPCIHEVDRDAVQIWFRFYPLGLHRYIEDAGKDARVPTLHGMAMQGVFELKDQIDSSHHFLYGHRFWPTVKCKILSEPPTSAGGKRDTGKAGHGDNEIGIAASPRLSVSKSLSSPLPPAHAGGSDLVDIIKDVAMRVAEKLKIERNLVNAISSVGLMTLNQVGMDAFRNADEGVRVPSGIMTKSPNAIVAERAKDDSQGIFGFLKTIDKKFSVNYLASAYNGKFPIMNEQEIVSASAKDRSQNWQQLDSRCWEGPVPVECTAASCGTCWVGVIGGKEKLDDVKRRERRQMKVFGYNQPDEARPFMRLACQARAAGNVTLVIPPWNGVFGKKVYDNVAEVELEPATTSAKALRETIATAASGDK